LASSQVSKVIVLSSYSFQGALSLSQSALYTEFTTEIRPFPNNLPLKDQFLATFVQLIHLHRLPTILLSAQAHKFSPASYLDTKQVVSLLAKGMKEVLPSFSPKINIPLLPNKKAFLTQNREKITENNIQHDERGKQSLSWYI